MPYMLTFQLVYIEVQNWRKRGLHFFISIGEFHPLPHSDEIVLMDVYAVIIPA